MDRTGPDCKVLLLCNVHTLSAENIADVLYSGRADVPGGGLHCDFALAPHRMQLDVNQHYCVQSNRGTSTSTSSGIDSRCVGIGRGRREYCL